MTWSPTLGAISKNNGTHFRVWAPQAAHIELILESSGAPKTYPLTKHHDGYHDIFCPDVYDGELYKYRVDGKGSFPDPASRSQPQGVHGPSQVINPHKYPWKDHHRHQTPLHSSIIYELHIGTFSPEGTFKGAQKKLPYLKELGITTIELMPVADFPGNRNWGYDGVSLYAPARCYGTPDDLRAFVDEAHHMGLAVMLDVVYNHFGPDGNYLSMYSPYYFTNKHKTPWGKAVNFDGEHNKHVRQFFTENALHWIHEYHVDGLRLDAVHEIKDNSTPHFMAHFTSDIKRHTKAPHPLLIAEDCRNLAHIVRSKAQNGWGLDGVWADDFHHQIRRQTAGDSDGYFQDFTGTTQDIARTLSQGWFYCGQKSKFWKTPRGTDPAGIPPERFIICLQNHDQIGNRAFGERLNHQINHAVYRAVSALLLFAPHTPLLFMGQEWAARTYFLYFTDHNPELGQKVTQGRRNEFKDFKAFSDPASLNKIPDPQSPATYSISQLNWMEQQNTRHAGMLRLYQSLTQMRRTQKAFTFKNINHFLIEKINQQVLVINRESSIGNNLILIICFKGSCKVHLNQPYIVGHKWQKFLSTEDPLFSPDPKPIQTDFTKTHITIDFPCPSAIILKENIF